MTEKPVTYQSLTESLLQDMLDNILRQHTLASVSRYRSLASTLGANQKERVFINDSISSSKDIYGQDKQKLKMTESSKYFQCENCGRSIAGSRFAQHMTKCLERRRK